MNKKETMLEVIQDKVGDKTLSFWCRVLPIRKPSWNTIDFKILYPIWWDEYTIVYTRVRSKDTIVDLMDSKIEKIIWHDVYLWDVLDYLYNKQTWLDWQDKEQYRIDLLVIMNLWEHKRKPIEEQSDECIEFIYNLLTDRLNEK